MPDWDMPWILLGRVALAAVLGVILGIERDLHGRPAGVRTAMLITIGSCLFAIISGEGYDEESGTVDPSRIASQIVVGIGFLGAGTIIKNGKEVIGLTTAASIWFAAAVGTAIGAGMELLGSMIAVGGLAFMVILEPLSAAMERIGNRRMQRKGGEVIEEK